MTPPPEPTALRLTRVPSAEEGALRLEVQGYLDYETGEGFLTAATRQLADAPDVKHLYLDCAELSGLDSMGLAMLLMLHRHASAAQATMHLEKRTPVLDRILAITGTLEHLAPGSQKAAGEQPQAQGLASGRTPGEQQAAESCGRGTRPDPEPHA
ncbi:STAS domain-containing protein [Streptomyces sp. NPDC001939]|uniref:STAS domain-containing protein n=1 Tax=unclassified Streptomyces TaxID=2593676 RepID=UPI0033FF6CA2